MKSDLNRRESKKIAVMAAIIVGFMVIAFMPMASAGVTSFTVTPSTGIVGAVQSYSAYVITDGVTSINITIPAGFSAVAPTTGGVEIARLDFHNSSTKAYYGHAIITANDTSSTPNTVDIYWELGGDAITTTQDVDYAPGATNTFESGFGDGSSAIITLPIGTQKGSIKITINSTAFLLDAVMTDIKQFVRNPTTAGDYTFYANGAGATVTILEEPCPYGGGVRRGRQWILRTDDSPSAEIIRVNWALSTDVAITGDWNGDGIDTIGVRRGRQWILSNSNTEPSVDIRVNWGMDTDIPVVGDWNGDGIDTLGLRRGRQWILSNSNEAPSVAIRVNWGMDTDIPVVGDWNGDGKDTLGLRRGRQWILSNSNTAPVAYHRFHYGLTTDEPITDDWNDDTIDTIGVHRGREWILRNSNSAGPADYRFNYGMSTDEPVTGHWV